MSVLSDISILKFYHQKRIGIKPFDSRNIQPCSLDLTLLANRPIKLLPYNYYTGRAISQIADCFIELIAELSSSEDRDISRFNGLADKIARIEEENKPHTSFQLLSTREVLTLPNDIRAVIHGRSSLARLGVYIHVSAGFVDAGFSGQITLECLNVSGKTVTLLPGDRVAQAEFCMLDNPSIDPYKGRYQNQMGPTKSKFGHGQN